MNITPDKFIAKHSITSRVERISARPDQEGGGTEWGDGARHWRVVLCHGRKRMTIYFTQGSAYTTPPTAAEVLDCVASDAAELENDDTFEGWANNYGYDTDSRKAEKTYRAVLRQVGKLCAFLDGDQYQELLWHTERL